MRVEFCEIKTFFTTRSSAALSFVYPYQRDNDAILSLNMQFRRIYALYLQLARSREELRFFFLGHTESSLFANLKNVGGVYLLAV